MPRFICPCIVAICLCATFPATGLTIDPGDQNVSLSIVPSNELSAPTGTVVAQNIQPLNISTANNGAFGSLESQVVKNPTTGDLTFVYTFLASAAPPGNAGVLPYYISSVAASGFSTFTTDVSASDQNAGTSSSSDFGQEVTGFVSRSSDGKTVTLDVPKSTDAAFFFDTMQIATDAKSFDDFGTATVTADESNVSPDSQTFTTFEPAVPASQVLQITCIGLLLVLFIHFRKTQRQMRLS